MYISELYTNNDNNKVLFLHTNDYTNMYTFNISNIFPLTRKHLQAFHDIFKYIDIDILQELIKLLNQLLQNSSIEYTGKPVKLYNKQLRINIAYFKMLLKDKQKELNLLKEELPF